jgi:pantothenate kinase
MTTTAMALVDDLARQAVTLATPDGRAILGITGAPGAGKTTLVEQLLERLRGNPPSWTASPDWVAHVPMDGFHLADVQLDRLGLRERKGAPDTFDAGGYVALLRRIKDEPDEVIYAPGFEREIEQPIAAAIRVPAQSRLIITEGNYLLLSDHPWVRVRHVADAVWYVDLDEQKRLDRLVRRHVEYGKPPAAALAWVQEIDQANAALIEATREHATLVVTHL